MTTPSEYEKLFTECLREGTRETLPPNCATRGWAVSETCRLAGGCPICYAEVLTRNEKRKGGN
jgi:hypothetical protein